MEKLLVDEGLLCNFLHRDTVVPAPAGAVVLVMVGILLKRFCFQVVGRNIENSPYVSLFLVKITNVMPEH